MGRNLTRKDIAEAAGVSPSTVSRALSGSKLLPKTTIDRICQVAKELGYQPNLLARRLATNRSYQIGFVAPLGIARKGTFQMSYFSTILDAMVSRAYFHGYSVSIQPFISGDQKSISKLKGLVQAREVDGLVFSGLTQRSKIPASLSKEKIPAVLVGSYTELPGVFAVNCDPLPGIQSMLKVLLEKGYRRLFFVQGNQTYYAATVQKRALKQAVKDVGFPYWELLEGDYSRKSGYQAAETLASKATNGDCVFLANDRMAMGFYRYCYEHGVAIPDTIGVVGSDDDEAATALYPDLSTIYQPRKEMGEAAVDLLIDVIEGKGRKPQSVMLDKTFLMRASV